MDASEIGVVFDCDGTLLDSMGAWHGLQTSWPNAREAR